VDKPTEDKANKSGAGHYVFDDDKRKEKQKEIEVFTKAKKLCEYVFQITKKAPKEYRWNLIDKILNASLELVQILYEANDTYDDRYEKKPNEIHVGSREKKQREADTKLKLIGWLSMLGNEMQVFNNHQTEYLGKLTLETRQCLWKWIKGVKEKGAGLDTT